MTRTFREGDDLPPLDIPVTRTLIVAGAIASRDYQDVHHDAERAREKGSPDIFMNILTTNGLVGRYITDHFGPTTVLRKVAIRLGAPNYPGDVLRLTGRIAEMTPAQPTERAEPSERAEPIERAEPAEPTQPTEPTDPTQPTQPVEAVVHVTGDNGIGRHVTGTVTVALTSTSTSTSTNTGPGPGPGTIGTDIVAPTHTKGHTKGQTKGRTKGAGT
ncbi:hypothetical protein [Streptomyces sp. NPDC101181]|uniref:hypothetical protein n=1 Tax=Streptomyces sp. NPDC101181 TaxID=3366125 RepID=UPI0037F18E1F